MSIRSSLAIVAFAATAFAQGRIDPQSTMHITLPEDSPVAVLTADWGGSSATPRGGAMLLELRTSLTMKNVAKRNIRGITLLVMAQDVTPGGKASVTVPSLNVAPGEAFPVRIDLRLLRPLASGGGPLAEVTLDGIIFDDLSFYGPDRLNSRRSMLVWELEARRDRKYFKDLLDGGGPEALRQEMVASLARQQERSASHARVAQGPRVTNLSGERQVQFAMLHMPGAPIEFDGGLARVAANELRSPIVYLGNTGTRSIRGVEMGWLVTDTGGHEFVAGAVPLELSLSPGQKTHVTQNVTFKFSRPDGQPIGIQDVRAFLNSVEFNDGKMWIPQRSKMLPTPSPEEQRLADLYRRRGLDALVKELNRF